MYYTFIFSEVKYNYPLLGIKCSFIEIDKYITYFYKNGEHMGFETTLNSDYRARLQLFKKYSESFFDETVKEGNVMFPLKANRGIVFPYTPNLYFARSVNYGQMDFKGANYPIYSYINSAPPIIPLIAQFTASSKEEAQYLLATFRFLNAMTQSDFGERAIASKKFGAPPPLMQFSYLGPFGFDRVPVLLTDFNMMLSNQVDYVPVPASSTGQQPDKDGKISSGIFASAFGSKSVTYVPTDVEFTINLTPQYSPRRIRKDFSLDDMKRGKNIGFI